MATLNRVTLIGNLTRDPQVRHILQETTVADLGLGVSETTRSKTGEQVDSTCFVDVSVWGKQAVACGKYLSKGSPVLVEGKLQFDQWESKEGEKRSKLRVRGTRVRSSWAMGRTAIDAPCRFSTADFANGCGRSYALSAVEPVAVSTLAAGRDSEPPGALRPASSLARLAS